MRHMLEIVRGSGIGILALGFAAVIPSRVLARNTSHLHGALPGCRMLEPAGHVRPASSGHVFNFGADGRFVFLQVTDIQTDGGQFNARGRKVLADAVARFHPSLIVVTGDMVDGRSTATNGFVRTADAITGAFKELKVPVALVWGNHDTASSDPDHCTGEFQWAYYRRALGGLFVDYDEPELSGVGNGVIAVHDAGDAKGARPPLWNLFCMDSGDYGDGGWDGPHSDQIGWYVHHSGGATPCLWFQHIPVPECADYGLVTLSPTNVPGSLRYGQDYIRLDPAKTVGTLAEPPCPTTRSFSRLRHLYEGRSLYETWLAVGNLKGAYFGHDHKNTFDGVDDNGIRMGYCKALTLWAYNDGNPGLRVFILNRDGTFQTDTITERQPEGTGFLGKLTPRTAPFPRR